jgi:hypothetical protein
VLTIINNLINDGPLFSFLVSNFFTLVIVFVIFLDGVFEVSLAQDFEQYLGEGEDDEGDPEDADFADQLFASVDLHVLAGFAVIIENGLVDVESCSYAVDGIKTGHIPNLHQVNFDKCASHEKSESDKFDHVVDNHEEQSSVVERRGVNMGVR